jgi:hypothetical protein
MSFSEQVIAGVVAQEVKYFFRVVVLGIALGIPIGFLLGWWLT